MTNNHPHHKLPDIHQSAWHLAAIQLTGMVSLPILASSVMVIQTNNFLSASITLILGNIILWLIRWGIISMSFTGRKSTLDIARDYVGKFGSYFIAILLLVATLAWFIVQTTLASNALTYLIPIEEPQINRFIQTSVALGICSTLLCMEGIVVLRWLAILTLPILLVAFVGVLLVSGPAIPAVPMTGISLSGLPLILGTSLGVTADLPTFFRHSASKRNSLWALAAIQLVSLGIGFGGLFLGSVIEPWFGIKTIEEFAAAKALARVFLVLLIFFSSISANVSNVYSASVGWELVAPKLAGRQEYLILGLLLTTIFILITNVLSLKFLLDISDSSLVNFCIVLIIAYLLQIFRKRHPLEREKKIYFFAWGIATVVNVLQYSGVIFTAMPSLVTGVILVLLVCSLALISKRFKKEDQAGEGT